MDEDLRSIQQAREFVRAASEAQKRFEHASQESVDKIVSAMARAGAEAAEHLARLAHEETGFGRVDSKTMKNLFSTTTLVERMEGMKTCGIIRRLDGNSIWEIATPMGVVAALIPSTNPTSTALYKAIISAKARCGIVMSPHPRAASCTAEALKTVAEGAYRAGAPRGLFACMTEVTLAGTNELLENEGTDVILATGGTPMVRAAYSKGKPAYGVGSGNVPVYVDRSADVEKAAADLIYGASFDWGTLCSTERSVVADLPIRGKLIERMKAEGAYFATESEAQKLRSFVVQRGRLNVEQVGKPPAWIAAMAGFSVPESTLALIAEVTEVGKQEPLSMETLSPVLSFYSEDGWEKGCERCIEILEFGGIGHTLGLHCTNQRVIEAFALEKPAMRIVVNTVAALGSVGYTNGLFPSMTLGPGTIGGSITSDNISPMHLLNIKRLAFETKPVTSRAAGTKSKRASTAGGSTKSRPASWIDEIDARLRQRAGNPPTPRTPRSQPQTPADTSAERSADRESPARSSGGLSEERIADLVARFGK